MLRTRLTEAYGLEVSFIGAGMGFVATPALVAAVSNAGGMGTLGAALVPPNQLREFIRHTRSLTAAPFGVNFVTEFTEAAHLEVCMEERVPVVSFFWNDPPLASIRRLQAAGVKVWMQVGSLEEAREAVRGGVDAVVVQGRKPVDTTAALGRSSRWSQPSWMPSPPFPSLRPGASPTDEAWSRRWRWGQRQFGSGHGWWRARRPMRMTRTNSASSRPTLPIPCARPSLVLSGRIRRCGSFAIGWSTRGAPASRRSSIPRPPRVHRAYNPCRPARPAAQVLVPPAYARYNGRLRRNGAHRRGKCRLSRKQSNPPVTLCTK